MGIGRRATQAEAEDAIDNVGWLTALRAAQFLAANITASVSTAITGLLATLSQATTGTNNTRLMTPLRVNDAMEDFVADFAKMGSTTDVPIALIPNTVTFDSEVENFAKNASSTRLDVAKLPTNVRVARSGTADPDDAVGVNGDLYYKRS